MEKLDQQSATNLLEDETNNDHEGQIGTTLKDFLRTLPDSIFRLHYNLMGHIVLTEEQFDLVRKVYDKNFNEPDTALVYQLFQNFLYIRNA
mmetsp:Transcript_5005/g.5899  ORF Transcript_5005/g.5899 Transcript_5005/m.5899 type:complete len:91 (-) Transcript_5005:60-332(-)